MTRYALKDKERQAKLDSLCDENKFSEELQETCREKLGNNTNFVCVHFGKIALKNAEGGKYHFSEFNVRILKSDIEVIEDLKPNIWYPREKFDGNPNRYVLVERSDDDDEEFYDISNEDPSMKLYSYSTHFMYIERPEVRNDMDETM